MNGVDSIRAALSEIIIVLDVLNDENGIFDQVDVFLNLSRENETVQSVVLFIPSFTDSGDDASVIHRYAIWEKIAEGIGNLQALHEFEITHYEWEPFVPNFEILACILRRLRRGIRLCISDNAPLLWHPEALPAFAKVIHGHAMITGFNAGDLSLPFQRLDILCSALLTLPALENVSFGQLDSQGPAEGPSLESMAELLQSPVLRQVAFESIESVVFMNSLLQALAKALEERSEITDLNFFSCSFPEGGSAVIARALKTNTTLKCLHLCDGADEVFCEVLAAALLSNSTLQVLVLGFSTPGSSGSCSWLSPVFLALQVNKGLKELSFLGDFLNGEELSTPMRLGLGKNTMLESLKLSAIMVHKDTCLWREAFSFLRTNAALKTLDMEFDENVTESHATAIRMEVAAALRENKSLETLSIFYKDA
jgi:hypothetical protein